MRRSLAFVVASCVIALVMSTMVQAATFTWANSGSDWFTAANWLGPTPPPGGADVGQFNLPSYSFQPNVGEPDTIGGAWNTGAGAVTITGSSILTIDGATINGNANTGIELDAGAGSMTVSAPIALGGSQQWLNNSGSALTVSGPLYLGLNSLTFSGGGQTSVSAPISGQGNLVVAPGANVVLSTSSASTANSYVGTTQINGGLLTLQGPAGSTILPQSTAVSLASGGTLNINGLSTTIPSLVGDSTSQILLGAGMLSTGALNANTVFAGSIGGPGGLTKINGGTFVLSGTNTYSGATSISAGVLQIDGGNALSPNSTVFFPASTTLSYLNDGTGNNGAISQGNNITLSAASITATVNVGGLTGLNTGNTVSFGTLTTSTSANAFFNTVNFTAANSYKQSYAGLNLPGSTGNSTQLNASSGTVIINGPVNNQMAAGGGFDTLFLEASTTGNQIPAILPTGRTTPPSAVATLGSPTTARGSGF
jgi:autotransporter-associated beta strand protein